MKKYTVFFVLCVASALFCSSVFAIAPLRAFTKTSAEPQPEATPVIESEETSTNSMPTTTDSETSSTGFDPIDTVIAKIDEMGYMWPKTYDSYKEELKAELVAVADDIGKDIEQLKKDLKKEQRAKFLGEFSLLFGCKETPVFGAGASMGVRFGSGLILKGGVSYMGVTMNEIKALDFSWDPTNIIGQMSIGFEW